MSVLGRPGEEVNHGAPRVENSIPSFDDGSSESPEFLGVSDQGGNTEVCCQDDFYSAHRNVQPLPASRRALGGQPTHRAPLAGIAAISALADSTPCEHCDRGLDREEEMKQPKPALYPLTACT